MLAPKRFGRSWTGLSPTPKKNTLASRRLVAKTVHVKAVYQKLYNEILPQFSERTSGFTRVIKLGIRRGDGAAISVVELLTPRPVHVEEPKDKDKKGKKGATRPAPKKAAAKKTPKSDKGSDSKKGKKPRATKTAAKNA
jgi:large subunit ribosomal protein L17